MNRVDPIFAQYNPAKPEHRCGAIDADPFNEVVFGINDGTEADQSLDDRGEGTAVLF